MTENETLLQEFRNAWEEANGDRELEMLGRCFEAWKKMPELFRNQRLTIGQSFTMFHYRDEFVRKGLV